MPCESIHWLLTVTFLHPAIGTESVTVQVRVNTDVVSVKVNPLKDGRFGGNYTSVTAADGKVYE